MTVAPPPPGSEQPPPPPPPSSSTVWKQVLLGLVILVSGIVLGVGGTLVLAPRKVSPPPFEPQRFTDLVIRRLDCRLQLTPEQAREVRKIVRKHMRAIEQVRKKARPQLVKEIEAMKEEVASVLDTEQARLWRDQFDRLHRFGPFHGFSPGFQGKRGRSWRPRFHPPGERKGEAPGGPLPGPRPWQRRHRGGGPPADWRLTPGPPTEGAENPPPPEKPGPKAP